MINEKCKMTAESPFTARHDFAIFILHLSFFNPSSFKETTSRQNGFLQSRVREWGTSAICIIGFDTMPSLGSASTAREWTGNECQRCIKEKSMNEGIEATAVGVDVIGQMA
jgi:hypothetical protein